MTNEEILKKIDYCFDMTEMDGKPDIAFEQDEFGDTRFLEDGSFVIYDVKTSLSAKDFKKIQYKGHDNYVRDPFVFFQLTGGRSIEISCIPGNMRTADVKSFIRELVEKFDGVIDLDSHYTKYAIF